MEVFMGNKDLVILSLIGAFMLLLIITIFLSFYNNKRFIAVCDLYEKEVGPLPLKITICKEAGFFSTPALYGPKVNFILCPLIFKKNNSMFKYSTKGEYEFINSLPTHYKKWFLIEYGCLFLAVFVIILAMIAFKAMVES